MGWWPFRELLGGLFSFDGDSGAGQPPPPQRSSFQAPPPPRSSYQASPPPRSSFQAAPPRSSIHEPPPARWTVRPTMTAASDTAGEVRPSVNHDPQTTYDASPESPATARLSYAEVKCFMQPAFAKTML